jgi:hypothetical protein
MARMTFDVDEVQSGEMLPAICCRCGDAATGQSDVKLTYTPKWILLFVLFCFPIYFILSITTTRRLTVTMPTCDRHQWLGLWRKLLATGGVVAIVSCVVWMAVTMRSMSPSFWDRIDNVVQFAGIVGGVVILLLSGMMFLRPARMTATEITLAGLSPTFTEAVEQYRILLDEFSE